MTHPKLLVVDDDEAIRTQMKWALNDEYEVLLAYDRPSAIEQMKLERPPLVALDLGLPPSPREADEGLATLGELLTIDPHVKIVIITGNHDKTNALRAIEYGACDVFGKPVDIHEVRIVLKRARFLAELERENAALREQVGGFEQILGESPPMQRVFASIRKVAGTDASVLVTGESGTGKELVAKAIHRSSNRRDGPFITINCGAIPETLLESELFGHEKGAFTSADVRRKGKVEYADGGTLFLDEIGELSPSLQVKLLRFLQEHQFERVGGREIITVDVRVIAATNRDLKQEAADKRFRDDLFYRLAIVTITVPPLRDRDEDIVLMAKAFLQQSARQYQKELKGFSADALAGIRLSPWPGNVRELENRIKRAAIMAENKVVTAHDLELDTTATIDQSLSLREVREQVERKHVMAVLQRYNGNVSQAAGALGVSRPTLHDLIKRYRIPRETDAD